MKKVTIYRLSGSEFGVARWVKHTTWEGESVDVYVETKGRFTVYESVGGGGRADLAKYSDLIFAFAVEDVREGETEPENDAPRSAAVQ